ncbi:MAG: phosphatidylserine decarboxylase [Alphaproteobacteria bacterium]|nr:phosphatidylserine decarboxylase [Alphaproteobacteria bacterium]
MYRLRLHRDGWPFLIAFAAAALLLGSFYGPLGWIGLVCTLWCGWFFRDPDRVVPTREGLVVSPADGVVHAVQSVEPPAEFGLSTEMHTRISIFLDIFSVHVNRIPIAGTITELVYRPGKFFNASLDKASEFNERQVVRITMAEGQAIGLAQIAGLVARRIRCDLQRNQPVETGERFGIIRFGSRVDLYLPQNVNALVAAGQKVVGGETVLADLRSDEPARAGEIR